MKKLTNFQQSVETGVDPQLVPLSRGAALYRVATLNCEYFYFPLNGMPSPSQGYHKQ